MIFLNGTKIEFGQFPNGEANLPKLKQSDVNTIILKYEDDRDLFRLLLVRQWLDEPVHLHITYFPYSRMDRRSDDYEFTLYSVADYINLLDFSSVTIYEPHSDVTPALLEKVIIESPIPYLIGKLDVEYLPTKWAWQPFYPDAGAQKRYSEFLNIEDELVGFKKRDFKTGRITDLQIIGKRLSNTVVIVDDLCSKGGTFVLAAEKLHEMGFEKVYLVVAHCEKTIFEGKILITDLIDGVYTTDSIIDIDGGHEHSKLHIFPLIQ